MVFSILFLSFNGAQAQNLCLDLFEAEHRPSEVHEVFTAEYKAPHPLMQFPEVYERLQKHENFETLDFYFSQKIWRKAASRIASEQFSATLEKMSHEKASAETLDSYFDFVLNINGFIEVMDQAYLKKESTKVELIQLITDPKNKAHFKPLLKIAESILQTQTSNSSSVTYRSYLKAKALTDALDKFAGRIADISVNRNDPNLAVLVLDVVSEIKFLENYFSEITKKEQADVKLRRQEIARQKKEAKDLEARHEKVVRRNYNKIRPLLREQFPNDVIAGQDHFRNVFESAFHIYFYPGAHIMLTKLLNYSWYRNLIVEDRKAIYILLLKMHHYAESDADEGHRQLIKNTAEFISNGYYNLYSNRFPKGEAGYAGDNHISITYNYFMRILYDKQNKEDWYTKFDHQTNAAIGILAHEVSHIISGQKVEPSYAYFLEEYRANQVDFYAARGRPPGKRESLKRALELILNISSLYSAISMAFKLDRTDFKHFLSQFDKDRADEIYEKVLSYSQSYYRNREFDGKYIDGLVETIEDGAVGYQVGWDGFLFNEPKDKSKKFKQPQTVFPHLIKKIHKLESE